MSRKEYIRIHSKYFPPNIRALYHIDGLISEDGYVYIKIIKGVYGLKQATIIAYNQLISHMKPNGYYSAPFMTGIWAHKTRRSKCCLCVGDFRVKYLTKSSSRFPKKHCAISTYSEGRNYPVLAIDLNDSRGYFEISLPEYVKKLLDILQHLKTKRPQYTPHLWTAPT